MVLLTTCLAALRAILRVLADTGGFQHSTCIYAEGRLWAWKLMGVATTHVVSLVIAPSTLLCYSVWDTALPMATCSGLSPVSPVSPRKAKRWW